MKQIFLVFVFLFFLKGTSEAQPYSLSEEAQISIITVGPGKNLYDKFGHSAFRVQDPQNELDWAYNYGTYDFNTPNFYTKFAQGKLLYELSVWPFQGFLDLYKRENRWVKEQVLHLTPSEKNELFRYLQNNAKPENKQYHYDFFYDNCATKIRDVLKAVLKNKVQYNDSFVTEEYTFRELIQKNVHANTWGSLGMDVAIGAVVDKKASAWEYQFLPQYVYEAAAVATLEHQGTQEPLVKETHWLFENTPREANSSFFASPLFIFGILAFIILWVTVRDLKNNQRSRFLDGSIFLITGLIGIILLLLWFATDHSSTVNNYNLLWAFPLSILFSVAISRKNPPTWLRKYVFLLVLMLALLGLHSITGVQKFAIALIPLFVALGVRYVFLLNYFSVKK